MSHVSWSQLENGASLFRNAPTSVSSEVEEDEYGDDSPRLASPDNKNLRIFSRPSTSSRALKSFAQCQEKSKEEEDSSGSIATPLNRLKSRTAQHKQQQKKEKKKAFSMKKALKNTTREKEQNFQLRAIVTRSPEPSKRALAPSLKEPNEVHTKVSDGSTLFRRAKREEKKVKVKMNNNNNNNCNIALIPEEKLEHLLRICREAAGGEHWREKMQALEQLSSRSHAYSISRSSSVLTRAIEDGGKHVQDLRACLAKAALEVFTCFVRALR